MVLIPTLNILFLGSRNMITKTDNDVEEIVRKVTYFRHVWFCVYDMFVLYMIFVHASEQLRGA